MAQFLEDMPASYEQNQFEIHDRIADAIVDEIQHDKSIKNRRIAIVGEWGSGKSTILDYVSLRLNNPNKPDHRVYCYSSFDLWAHSGESLRRSFLLKLYSNVDKMVAADDSKEYQEWKEIESKLSHEQQTKLTIEKQDLSPLAIFVVLIVALFGLLKIIGAAVADFLPPDCSVLTYADTLLVSLTIIIALIGLRVITGESPKRTFGGVRDGIKEVAKHLGGRPTTETTTTTQSELLGSLAFEKYIDEMMRTAHRLSPDLVAVVTLDNLDRLSDEHIREAWDSIQIFASYMDRCGQDSMPSWLLLPVSGRTIDSILNKDSYGLDYAALSKLFIIQYDIPRPIRSEWKQAVLEQLSMAFPESSSQTRQVIFSILNSFPDTVFLRTPRENKRVINEMVALKKVYKEVELEDIAIFVYCRHKYFIENENVRSDEPENHISFEEYMSGIFAKEENSDELPPTPSGDAEFIHLAMMTYGVFDESSAGEAFLVTEMLKDRFDLESYVNSSMGAWDTIGKCVENGVLNTDGEEGRRKYCSLLNQISNYNCAGATAEAARDALLQTLEALLPESDWPSFPNSSDGVIHLYDRAVDKRRVLHDLSLSIMASVKAAAKGSQEDYESWCAEVISAIGSLHARETISDMPTISMDLGDRLYDFIAKVAELDDAGDYAKLFSFGNAEAFKGIVKRLIEERPAGNGKVEITAYLAKTDLFQAEFDGLSYDNLQELGLQNGQQIAQFFFEAWNINRLKESPGAKRYLRAVSENNRLDSSCYSEAESVYDWAAAVGYSLQRSICGPQKHDPSQMLNQYGESIDVETAKVYACSGNRESNELYLRDIFTQLDEAPYSALCKRLAKFLVEDEDNCAGIDFDFTKEYLLLIGEDERKALEPKIAEAYSAEQVMHAGFSASLCSMYLSMANMYENDVFKEWVRQSLIECDASIWAKGIKLDSNTASLKLLNYAFEENEIPRKIEEVIAGDVGTEDLISRCEILDGEGLFTKLSPEGFSQISNQMVVTFKTLHWKLLLARLGNSLSRRGWLQALDFDDLAAVAEVILDARTKSSAQWLQKELMKTNVELLVSKGIGDRIRNKAQTILSHARRSDPKDLKEILAGIIELLK